MQATKSATKPTKQRKMIYQAPDHIRYKLFAAPLSSELKASQKIRSIPVRSGDTVRVMRGDHKGFEGKVSRVDREKYRVYVEGLTREKGDGTTIFVPVHPSKIMITKLNLDDKWRKKILERKKETVKKAEEIIEKPALRKAKMPEIVETKEKPAEGKTVVEEKTPETKLRKPRRKIAKKPAAEKIEQKAEESEKKAKPKTTRKRATRKTAKKTAETEGGA